MHKFQRQIICRVLSSRTCSLVIFQIVRLYLHDGTLTALIIMQCPLCKCLHLPCDENVFSYYLEKIQQQKKSRCDEGGKAILILMLLLFLIPNTKIPILSISNNAKRLTPISLPLTFYHFVSISYLFSLFFLHFIHAFGSQ